MIRTALVLFFACALAAGQSAAQDLPADSAQATAPGRVLVESNLAEGALYANEAPVGSVGEGDVVELEPGVYVLVLREPNREAWQARQARAEVVVRSGETTTVRLDVPYRYRVESFPYGATVSLVGAAGEEVLGETPLDLQTEAPLEGDLVVTIPGHGSARQPAGAAAENRYSFVLKPLVAEDERTAEVGWSGPDGANVWIDVAAVGLALTAGAVSVYYKFKGDDLYDVYARSGDPALRPEFERYDTYSAVALGAMQVGIGVFAIRLVLR